MDNEPIKNNLRIVLGVIILILIIMAFVPMSWISKQNNNASNNGGLDLINQKLSNEYVNSQGAGSDVPNWKQALLDYAPTQALSSQTVDKNSDNYKSLSDPNNLTAQFAKNAYSISAYLSQQGITDQNTIDTVSQNLTQAQLDLLKPKIYTSSYLETTTNNEPSTIKAYGNNLAKYFTDTYKVVFGTDDIAIMNTYIINKDSTVLLPLNKKIENLTTLRDNLKNMTIPETAVENHLLILNSVEAYLNVVTNISKIKTDPLRASIAFKDDLIGGKILKNLNNIKSYFRAQNVTFTDKELGFIFN